MAASCSCFSALVSTEGGWPDAGLRRSVGGGGGCPQGAGASGKALLALRVLPHCGHGPPPHPVPLNSETHVLNVSRCEFQAGS